MTETITLQCKCGRFLRGTVEREPKREFPVPYHGNIKVTVSQVMARCPGCGSIATSPIEIKSEPVPAK